MAARLPLPLSASLTALESPSPKPSPPYSNCSCNILALHFATKRPALEVHANILLRSTTLLRRVLVKNPALEKTILREHEASDHPPALAAGNSRAPWKDSAPIAGPMDLLAQRLYAFSGCLDENLVISMGKHFRFDVIHSPYQ